MRGQTYYTYRGVLIPERPLEPPDCWEETGGHCDDIEEGEDDTDESREI